MGYYIAVFLCVKDVYRWAEMEKFDGAIYKIAEKKKGR
jgi:hypothetical protein